MSFIKRATLSITRKKGKSLLLLALLFILGNMIAGAISMKQAASNVEKKIKGELGAAVTLEVDYENYQQRVEEAEGEPVSVERLNSTLIEQIGASSYVKYYDYTDTTEGNSPTIERWTPDESTGFIGGGTSHGDFNFSGVQYHKVMAIEEGKQRLLPGGRVFTEEEIQSGKPVAIITKLLAEKNNLRVGDSILFTFTSEFFDHDSGEKISNHQQERSFEIIGITERPELPQTKQNRLAFDQQIYTANRIIVPINVVFEMKKNNLQKALEDSDFEPEIIRKILENSQSFFPIYILKDPMDTEAFKSETLPQLPEFYQVKTATDEFTKIAGPVSQIAKMADWLLTVAFSASILIVNLVVLLFLRDRRHEFGVYLALGEKKSKVIGQVLTEILVIALIALSLSIFTGNVLANNVSNSMIQTELDSTQERLGGKSYFFGVEDYFNSDLTTTDVVEHYQIHLSSTYVGLFSLAALLTIVGSTLIPMYYLLRLNPKKIMM